MTISELYKEINEIQKDETLSNSEKKTLISIYGAEKERQQWDEVIKHSKNMIENLRKKIIDDILKLLPSLDIEAKEVANELLTMLSLPTNYPHFKGLNDVVSIYEAYDSDIIGEIPVYLSDKIHGDLEKIKNLDNQLIQYIIIKYSKINQLLDGIIDIGFNNTNEDFKEEKEYNNIYVKGNEKISCLNISGNEKTILRGILDDAVKYGKSSGCIYTELSDLSDYVAEQRDEVKPTF